MTDLVTLIGLYWEFFVNVFLLGFCQHLLLPAVVMLSLLMLSGRLAEGYGLPRLVRHEMGYKRFFVGVAFGVLLIKTVFVGYLLETARGDGSLTLHALLAREDVPAAWLSAPVVVYVVGVALSVVVLLLLVVGGIALISLAAERKARDAAQASPPPAPTAPNQAAAALPSPWLLVVGVVTAFALFALLLWGVSQSKWVQDHLAWVGGLSFAPFKYLLPGYTGHVASYPERVGQEPALPRTPNMAMHGIAVYSTILNALFYILLVPNRRLRGYFSPIVAGCFLLNVVVATVGWLGFFLPGAPPVLVVVLVLLVALGGVSRY
jgi:hypothetical protein